jgi:hypothetical protein
MEGKLTDSGVVNALGDLLEAMAEKSAESVKDHHPDYVFRETYKAFYMEGFLACLKLAIEDSGLIIEIDTNGKLTFKTD